MRACLSDSTFPRYKNEGSDPIEAVYTFPLEVRAAQGGVDPSHPPRRWQWGDVMPSCLLLLSPPASSLIPSCVVLVCERAVGGRGEGLPLHGGRQDGQGAGQTKRASQTDRQTDRPVA